MAVTVGAAGYSSVKPGQYDPSWGVPCPNRIWATTGNTDIVIDASVHPTDCILITATTAQAGTWHVTVGQGTFTVTSTDSESATTTAYNYFICGN
jgi:hypothetical protein